MNRPLIIGLSFIVLLCVGAAAFVTLNSPTPSLSPTISGQTNTPIVEEQRRDEFTPPTTRLVNANPARAGARQILIATSSDGITFTPSGVRLTAQGNVPDMVVASDGTIFAYYIGQSISQNDEDTVVAKSVDNGATWTYHFLTFNNLPSPRQPGDPDVVLLPDGTFRMFYTDSVDEALIGIRYADSTDGMTFTYGGIALNAGIPVADSTTFFQNGTWTMLVIDHSPDFLFKQYKATSTDGKTFTYVGEVGDVVGPTGTYFLSNPLIEHDDLRMIGFGGDNQTLESFSSPDTITWTSDPTPILSASPLSLQGGTYLQDSSVAKLANGTYLLLYVTDMAQ